MTRRAPLSRGRLAGSKKLFRRKGRRNETLVDKMDKDRCISQGISLDDDHSSIQLEDCRTMFVQDQGELLSL